jgi:hypothetical protein
VLLALLPLILTGTASFGAAREECHAKTVARLKAKFLDFDSPQTMRPQLERPWGIENDFGDTAGRWLLPVYSFNSISTVVSLFGFGAWLFFSPHDSDVAKDLDRAFGSCFAL